MTARYPRLGNLLVVTRVLDGLCKNTVCASGNLGFYKESKRKKAGNKNSASSFPEWLVLGPDQLNAIECDSDRIIVFGEAGCGKTIVLLYMLYQYTANTLKHSDLKKVVFLIPKNKTELLKFVKNFIRDHCNRDYVSVIDGPLLVYLSREENRDTELILIDELQIDSCLASKEWYGIVGADEYLGTFEMLDRFKGKVYASLGSFIAWYPQIRSRKSFKIWTSFHLRACYRCPVNISARCMKLRHRALTRARWKGYFPLGNPS